MHFAYEHFPYSSAQDPVPRGVPACPWYLLSEPRTSQPLSLGNKAGNQLLCGTSTIAVLLFLIIIQPLIPLLDYKRLGLYMLSAHQHLQVPDAQMRTPGVGPGTPTRLLVSSAAWEEPLLLGSLFLHCSSQTLSRCLYFGPLPDAPVPSSVTIKNSYGL